MKNFSFLFPFLKGRDIKGMMDVDKLATSYILGKNVSKDEVMSLITLIHTHFPRTRYLPSTNLHALIDLVVDHSHEILSFSTSGNGGIRSKETIGKYLLPSFSEDDINYLESYLDRDGNVFNINVSFIPEFRTQIFQEINRVLRDQLMQVRLLPLNKTKLHHQIQERFVRALVPPGEALGPITGQSSIAPQSQAALNSNHNIAAGKNLEGGVVQLDETFDLKANRKLPITYLHFHNKFMTWNDVYEMRYKYVNVMLSDLVNFDEIRNVRYDELVAEKGVKWWFPFDSITNQRAPSTMVATLTQKGTLLTGTSDVPVNKEEFLPYITYLPLYSNKVYLSRVSMEQIGQAIEAYINIPNQYVKCIVSPITEGIIYVLTYRNMINQYMPAGTAGDEKTPKDMPWLQDQAFNEIAIISRLREISIAGVSEVKSLFPKKIAIKNYFMEEIGLSSISGGASTFIKEGRLYYSAVNLRGDGVPITRLVYLLRAVGVTILSHADDYFIVRYTTTNPKQKVMDLLNEKISAAEKAIKEYENYLDQMNSVRQEQMDGIIIPTSYNAKPKPSAEEYQIENLAYYVYARLIGTNLEKFLMFPEVDSRYSYTNIFNDMIRFWDIEALRNYLYKEIVFLFEQMDTPIHYSIPMRIASHMTMLGFGIPLTHIGVKHRGGGPLAKASMDRPLEYIKAGAASGACDRTSEVSAAVIFGTKIKVGTGLVKITIPPAENAENEYAEYLFPESGYGVLPKVNKFEDINVSGLSAPHKTFTFNAITGSGILPHNYEYFPTPISAEFSLPEILVGIISS